MTITDEPRYSSPMSEQDDADEHDGGLGLIQDVLNTDAETFEGIRDHVRAMGDSADWIIDGDVGPVTQETLAAMCHGYRVHITGRVKIVPGDVDDAQVAALKARMHRL